MGDEFKFSDKDFSGANNGSGKNENIYSNSPVNSSGEQKRTSGGDTVFYNKSELRQKMDQQGGKDSPQADRKLQKEQEKLRKKREKQEKKARDCENRYLFKMLWIVMVVLVSVVLAKYILVGVSDMLAIDKEEKTVMVNIDKGAGLRQVADTLEEAGMIDSPGFFRLYATLTKASKGFSNGSFEMRTDMDYQAIINYLQSQANRVDTLEVTIPEGRNVFEYAEILSENGVCSAEEFLEACNSDAFDKNYQFISKMENASDRYYKLEGYMFPDTYEFYKEEKPEKVINRLLTNFEDKLEEKIWVSGYDEKISIKEQAEKQGLTINDLTIIASLVQAEAADVQDMYFISSVIQNRLRTLSNMGISPHGDAGLSLLGIDSTVWHPYRTKADVPAEVQPSFKSRYNTYEIEGLPPGAVCNPGLEAFKAALNPKDTDYYYFCHSADGTAYYATNSSAHQRNLAAAGLE